ncbi:hypothetical protein F5Y09DRAFT_350313 [Xylaria sp. FL1042]|nr:hypothetical protein F5Y09DRAFT_350313 [Xylaria sp. FL1042]
MDILLQTTSSTSIAISRPVIDSPSDLSYSYGPSHTSTRNTSPDSLSTGSISRHSSPFTSLRVATANIEYTSDPFLGQPPNMDNNAFQSVNDRRNKLVNERQSGTQHHHTQQQRQHLTSPQLQIVRPNVQASPSHQRSLTSTNWRTPTVEDVVVSQPRIMYNPYEAANTAHHSQHSSIRTTSFTNIRGDQHHHLQHVASVVSYPNLSALFGASLDESFAYCYDRGNGQYTRLIPADMLPPLQNIPAIQQGYTGMIVLPQPRGLASNGHSSNTEPVVVRRSPATPTSPADTIQSRIDNIVAATPPAPIHSSPNSSNNASLGHRRPKIYCDKWVHEGVCAFTQQGCKYKHEMPSDKATQHQLGLFHGYPQWWKKHQADLVRQREAAPPEGPKNSGQGNDSRIRNERYLSRSASSTTGSGGTRSGNLGLTTDGGRQIAWRHSGEYGGDLQTLGPPSSMGRTITSRGMCGIMRNPMVPTSSDNSLSPRPASYGSPFGPIAPPARSRATSTITTESARCPAMGQSTMGCHATLYDTRRSSPGGTSITASSIIPTSNPYASLEALDDSDDDNPKEGVTHTDASRPGGGHLL